MKNNILPGGLFSDFGMEPTWHFNIKLSDWISESYTESIFDNLTDAFLEKVKSEDMDKLTKGLFHLGHWRFYNDSDVLETATPRFNNFDSFLKAYRLLTKKLNDYNFLPSSVVNIESEGGCHISFDLGKVQEENTGLDMDLLVHNLCCVLCNNPSLVWSFLAPNDNISSNINFRTDPDDYGKGDMITVAYKTERITQDSSEIVTIIYPDGRQEKEKRVKHLPPTYKKVWGKLELRFFMMPRTEDEMVLQFRFANALMNYVKTITEKGTKFTIKATYKKKYEKYNGRIAKGEVLQMLLKIAPHLLPLFKKLKLPLLRERMSYGSEFKV